MSNLAMVVDDERNLGEVVRIQLRYPLHRLGLVLRCLVRHGIVLLVADIMAFAPFSQPVSIYERCFLRVVETFRECLHECLVVFSPNRIHGKRSLAVRILAVRQPIFSPVVKDKLRCILPLISAVHHDAERYRKFKFFRTFDQFVDAARRVVPGILASCRIEVLPACPDVTSRGIIPDINFLSKFQNIDFRVEIGRVRRTGNIHDPAIERILQNSLPVRAYLDSCVACNLAAIPTISGRLFPLRASAGRNSGNRQDK